MTLVVLEWHRTLDYDYDYDYESVGITLGRLPLGRYDEV